MPDIRCQRIGQSRAKRLLEHSRKIAAAEDYALDPNSGFVNVEENDVVADDGEPGVLADVGPELVVLRTLADPPECLANLPNEGDCATGIVLGDPVGDFFHVTFDVRREFEAH